MQYRCCLLLATCFFRLFLRGWVGGWVGVENEINAISAFNKVGVEVEVEAELGKKEQIKTRLFSTFKPRRWKIGMQQNLKS